jgi:FkbM family methyltransferase
MSIITSNFPRGSMKLNLDPARLADNGILEWLQKGTYYEPDVSHTFVTTLREGDVVFDVGANLGYFTVLASVLVGRTGRVIAFEASAENVERLRRNLALNACENVTVVDKVAADREGEIEFFVNDAFDSGGLWTHEGPMPGVPDDRPPPVRRVLPATTVDAEWKRLSLPRPKLIKIDVEGAEQRVLEGARELLTREPPAFIVAELHGLGLAKLACSPDTLRGHMEGLGYSTFGLSYAGTLPRLIPAATRIHSEFIINLLFSRPEWVGEYWPAVMINPRAA